MKRNLIIVFVFLMASVGCRISDASAEDIYYDAAGRRIGTSRQSEGKKYYYGPGGELLGWSELSGGSYRYYDKRGKLLGYSQEEDGKMYFSGQ